MSIELLIGYVAGASALGSVFGLGLLCVLTVMVEKWKNRNAPDDDLEEDLEVRLYAANRRVDELFRQFEELKGSQIPAVLDAVDDTAAPKKPACAICGNTRVPIKAKGKCKRCYERILGRERRASAKAKASSRC